MSFSRLPYDKCAYAQKMKRSVTPGDYRLYMGYSENCKKCFRAGGRVSRYRSNPALVTMSTSAGGPPGAKTAPRYAWGSGAEPLSFGNIL